MLRQIIVDCVAYTFSNDDLDYCGWDFSFVTESLSLYKVFTLVKNSSSRMSLIFFHQLYGGIVTHRYVTV